MNIAYWHFRTGESLTLKLYPLTSGGVANGVTGDALAEPDAVNRPGYYVATVTESLTGLYMARILRADAVVAMGLLNLEGTGTYILGNGLNSLAGLPVTLSSAGLAQLAASATITLSVPTLQNGHLSLSLIRGDSYLAEHGRAIEFSRETFPDLDGEEEVTLTARMLDAPDSEEPPTFTLSGSIVVAEGVKVVRFEPTSAQSSAWTPGRYEFDVEIEFADGNTATFVGPNATLRVLADVTQNGS